MFAELIKQNHEAFFVYDIHKLEQNIEKIQRIFPRVDYFFYSVKSNPNPHLVKEISAFARMGFDVSSYEELSTVLSQGVDASRITFSGPAKNESAINLIKKNRLNSVHIDSVEEYEIFSETSQNLTLRIPLEESFSQKVGLSYSSIDKVLSNCPERRFKGIHVYLGRERASKEMSSTYLTKIKDLFAKYKSKFVNNPEVFLGPGLPQTEFLTSDMIPDYEMGLLHVECGRAISSEIGSYVSPILTMKKRDKNLLILDGGLQHLATHFSSPKFGQKNLNVKFYKADGNEVIVNENDQVFDIYGSLGIWHDLLIKDLQVPEGLSSGDWLKITPAGAYGVTAATNQFIGASFPKEYAKKQMTYNLISPTKFVSYLEAGSYENSKN